MPDGQTCAICHTHISERCEFYEGFGRPVWTVGQTCLHFVGIECEARDLTEPCNPAWGTCGVSLTEPNGYRGRIKQPILKTSCFKSF